MALIGYIIGFIWGIVVSYIINKICKYYKTKQIVEMMMDSIPEEELMQLFKEIEQTEDGDEQWHFILDKRFKQQIVINLQKVKFL